MKRFLIVLSVCFVSAANAATFLDTENKFLFSDEIVKNAIVEFVPETKQQPVADLYQDLMDQTTGKISVDSLFKVCRKAGFNTYKYDGFTQCKSFIQKMLTDAEISDDTGISGFCPGLDASGKNPNKLRSITDKNKIGDFCSSTNIRMGEVIFKPGYNCSCMASVCNPGFEFQGGACVTRLVNERGLYLHNSECPRHAHNVTTVNNNLEKCQAFCEQKYKSQSCQFVAVVYNETQCICSPTDAEIQAQYDAMQERINNLQYYDVCRRKKNNRGNDVCEEKAFNWVNVGKLQAVGLIEEYVRIHHNDTVHCDTTNTRGYLNDDYIKCSSLKQKKFYEFKFDDIKESIDNDIQAGLILGICNIHNVPSGVRKDPISGYAGYKRCNVACTNEMIKTANVFGLTAKTNGKYCTFSNRSIAATDAESQLAKIDGIDNYIFFHGIQIQGSQNVVDQLRQYIRSLGKPVRSFTCSKNVNEIKNSMMVGDDDILPCMLNGQPIDFVFDDFSESWLYVQEAGESAIQCIVSGGKYAGTKCYGLDKQQCLDANTLFLKKFPNASGMYWDGQECKMVDAGDAKTYDVLVQAGVGLVAGVDCLLLSHTGCLLFAADMVGLAAETTADVLSRGHVDEFLHISTRCNARECAISTIRDLAASAISVKGILDAASLNTVDSELARLIGLLEPSDLPGVSTDDWDQVITQLGGDPDDAGGTAIVWLGRIGLGVQMLSAGISGLRFTSKAIMALASNGSKAFNLAQAAYNFTDVLNNANTITDVVDGASDIARGLNAATDLADTATDVVRVANNASDVADIATDIVRTADNATDTADTVTDVVRVADNASDVADTATDIVRTAGNATDTADGVTDIARITDDVADSGRVMSSADELATVGVREITDSRGRVVYQDMRNGNRFMSYDDVLNRIDELPRSGVVSDIVRTADNATDTADTVTDATRIFGRTNADDIGMVDKGWDRAIFDGVDRFRHKKISYPGEAEDVRRALEATKGQHNLAYMGVKDGYIVIAYESDLERAWSAFNRVIDAEAVESEFVDLWRAYAPKNQTLEDFKEMADGDIVKMRNMAQTWRANDYDSLIAIEQGDFTRLYNRRPDIEEYIGVNGFDAAAEKFPEVRAILDRSAARQIAGSVNPVFDKMWGDYLATQESYNQCLGDPKCLQQVGLKLERMRTEMNNTPGFNRYISSGAQGNYSTFDPKVSEVYRYNKETDESLNAIHKASQQAQHEALIAYTAGDTAEALSKQKKADSLSDLVKEQTINTKKVAINQLAEIANMSNVEAIAAERAVQLKNIVDSNPRYTVMKQNYSTMTREQRIQFAQMLSDELLRANNIDFSIPVQGVDYSASNKLGGLVGTKNNVQMNFDPNKLETFEDFADTIAHEIGGHGIDELAPNKNALGAQLYRVSDDAYLNGAHVEYYRRNPLEKQAFKIGDKTYEIFRTQ